MCFNNENVSKDKTNFVERRNTVKKKLIIILAAAAMSKGKRSLTV